MEDILISTFAIAAELPDSLRRCLTAILGYIALIYDGKIAVTLQMPQIKLRCPLSTVEDVVLIFRRDRPAIGIYI
jgi:hypothetical protein